MPLASPFQRWISSGFKLFFKLLYHQFAWAYDAVAWVVSCGMWKDWVMSVLPHIRGPNVLEIGHGPGHLLVKLKKAGYSAVGLDESRYMGRQVVKRLSVLGLSRLCVNGYAQFMPFPGCSFHTVCATFPSEYIFDPYTLSEILRVLVPDGSLVLLPTAWFADTYKPGRLMSRIFRIIGQPPTNYDVYAKPLVTAGFLVTAEVHSLASSKTLILIATKPRTD